MRPFAIPAMANVHSHAFQVGLRGRGERSDRPDDDFWSWREGMYALAEALDPGRHARGRRARLPRDGGGGLRRGRRVPLRPPPARRDAVRRAERDGARAAPRRPPRPGCEIVLLPAAYHRGGHARFRDQTVDAFLARVDALRAGGPRGRRRRAQRPRRAGGLAARDRRLRGDPRARPPHPRPGAAARAGGVHGRARLLADRAARPHRLPHGPHDGRARDPRVRARRRAAGRQRRHRRDLPDHRGQPRRRPLPRARLPRRRRAAGDRQRQQRDRRPVRGGARAGDRRAARSAGRATRCWPRPATSGARWRATAAPASASTTPGP